MDVPQVDMELPSYVGKPLDEVVQLLENSMNVIAIVIFDTNNVRKDAGIWQGKL